MACIARLSQPSLAFQSMCHFPAPGISSGLKRVAICQFSSQRTAAVQVPEPCQNSAGTLQSDRLCAQDLEVITHYSS